ncbi:MAG: hypothetical protein LN573_02950 [Rickettsia endosymbiont of Oxypoda opaca]|nr:hypothetical protein [Rickettsia endosymbiont of Oxypoda opaca]
MNSFIKSLASSAGIVIINILSNNELVNFETRLDVIAEIFKKYSGDNDKIKYMLHAFQSINKSLIEEIGLDKLFAACEQCQDTTALPLNRYKVNPTSVDQQLDNIKTVLLKYNSNILDIYPDETNILGQTYNEDEGGY